MYTVFTCDIIFLSIVVFSPSVSTSNVFSVTSPKVPVYSFLPFSSFLNSLMFTSSPLNFFSCQSFLSSLSIPGDDISKKYCSSIGFASSIVSFISLLTFSQSSNDIPFSLSITILRILFEPSFVYITSYSSYPIFSILSFTRLSTFSSILPNFTSYFTRIKSEIFALALSFLFMSFIVYYFWG